MATLIPNGTKVDIVSPGHHMHRSWGIVRDFDGDYYHVAHADGDTEYIFERTELRVRRTASNAKKKNPMS